MSWKKYAPAVLAGFLVWGIVTALFRWIGPAVLTELADPRFPLVFAALEAAAAVSITAAVLLFRKWDSSPRSALRFGVIGSTIGLLLDTLSLWQHDWFFPRFTQGQLLSFTVWMTFAYGLFLLIPAAQDTLELARQKR